MSEREREEALAASIYAELFPDLASENEPLGDLICKVCFGIHATHKCDHDN